jgi:hypothetical protein
MQDRPGLRPGQAVFGASGAESLNGRPVFMDRPLLTIGRSPR